MNGKSIIANFSLILILAFAVEGLDAATGGEVYIASLEKLAQASLPESSPLPPPPEAVQLPMESPQPELKRIFPLDQMPNPVPPFPGQTDFNQEPKPDFKTFQPGLFDEEMERKFDEARKNQMAAQARSDIARLMRETNRLKKAFRGNALFDELLAKINGIKDIVNNPASEIDAIEEAMSETKDLWQELGSFQTIAEAQRVIKEYASVSKRLKKVIEAKATITMSEKIGLNLETARQKVLELDSRLNSLSSSQLDPEDAREIIESIREENPRDIEQTIYRMREVYNYMRRLRNANQKSSAEQTIKQAAEAFNGGDFHETLETIGAFFRNLQPQKTSAKQ
ncbi:MAG TPA: hypothetical protein VJB92_00525 [Candidatus Paceibacterota bacterium]